MKSGTSMLFFSLFSVSLASAAAISTNSGDHNNMNIQHTTEAEAEAVAEAEAEAEAETPFLFNETTWVRTTTQLYLWTLDYVFPLTLSSLRRILSASTCNSTTQALFHLELKTDRYPRETSWELIDISTASNGNITNEIIYSREYEYHIRDQSIIHNKTLCVPRDSCYKFKIYDRANDGICCKYGHGYVKLFYENILIMDRDGDFNSGTSSMSFGDACPSQAPSVSPAPSFYVTMPPDENETSPTSTFVVRVIIVLIVVAGIFLGVAICCYRERLMRQQRSGSTSSAINNNENSGSISAEEQKENRRLKVLTSIIHKVSKK